MTDSSLQMKRDAEEFLRTGIRGDALEWPESATEEFGEELLQACHRHGVAALLHSRVQSRGSWKGWPSPVRVQLERQEGLALLRQKVLDRELTNVLGRLDASGVRCLLVKGAAVSRLAYAEPHLRPRTDSDLWVTEAEFTTARSALVEIGYQPAAGAGGRLTQYQQGFRRICDASCEHLLDVHWKISNVQLFAEILQFEREWRDRISLPDLGPHAHTLNPISSLLLACLHRVAHHGGSRKLIWLCDMENLAGMLSDDQQERLIERARELEIEAVCRDSLAAAFDAFGSRVESTPLVHWLQEPLQGGETSAEFLSHANSRAGILLSDLRHLPGFRPKLQFIREHLFPPVRYMRQRHHGRSSLLLPWFYFVRLVNGIWQIFVTRVRRVTNQD